MSYDFSCPDRRGKSLKWDVNEDELPMWVADMDFKTAPEVISALRERVEHGVFGYIDVPDEWYAAYIDWWKRRHGLTIEKEWLAFCTGVIPAISSLVRKFTTPNERVVILTPVYNIFFNSIVNNGRKPLECPLAYSNGEYDIDFDLLEKALQQPQTTMMILCNPHNPVGKIWDKETLAKIGELCYANGVTVISDEIHCDLTAPNEEYVPFALASEICKNISITCVSPTKTFNLAGIQTSAIFIPNVHLRNRAIRAINTDEVAEPNVFACLAATAAFNEGEKWLDELRAYLWKNRVYAEEFINENIPPLKAIVGKATYLLWIDLNGLKNQPHASEIIRKEGKLVLNEGSSYGKAGEGFLRLNLATSFENLKEGLVRLKKSVDLIKSNR
ncbi:MAG: pyridoxal phosphate-dependent aminotransferase [Clostridia bacterium]|nr:pyridoxal phosphate-dependent aminotransferase [Clostridia bacterium]